MPVMMSELVYGLPHKATASNKSPLFTMMKFWKFGTPAITSFVSHVLSSAGMHKIHCLLRITSLVKAPKTFSLCKTISSWFGRERQVQNETHNKKLITIIPVFQ